LWLPNLLPLLHLWLLPWQPVNHASAAAINQPPVREALLHRQSPLRFSCCWCTQLPKGHRRLQPIPHCWMLPAAGCLSSLLHIVLHSRNP
jgi:hypothetical protein